MMKASFMGVLIVVLGVSAVFSLPVSYQGKLTYTGGVGINDTFDVAMSIWDAPTGGTLVDADTVSGVVVYHGLFSTIFDINIPPAYSSTPLYIQISVDTTGTGTWVVLSPRQVITAAFWAMWTNNSVNAVYADTASYVLGNNVEYDNSGSGLASGTVQGAIDELVDSLNAVDLQKAYDNGNTILGDNSLSVTLNPGFGRAIYAKVGKDGPSSSTAAAVYARNDSTGPAIYASGNIVQASGKYIGTNGDVRVLLDINNNSDDHFRVYNGDSTIVFDVNEHGLAQVSGIQVDSINLGGDWHTKFFQQLRAEGNPWLGDSVTFVAGSNITLTQTGDTIEISATGGGGTVNDSNFIQNQDTVAQPASFWVKNKGTIGGVTTYGPAERITGAGTGSSGYYPLADWYHYSRTVMLITADEIDVDGPCIIDTLGLYLAEADSDAWIYDSVRIWIEMTTATSVPTTWDVSGATLVFSSDSLYLEQNVGWYNFDITDFNYDGTSNLIIYFQNGNQHTLYGTKGPDWRYTTQSTNDYFAYYHSDGDWGTSMNNSTFRPDVRLHMENVPSIVDKVEIENGEVRADNDVIIGGTALSSAGGAGLIGYDNSASGLSATNVQAAIDEVKANFDAFGSSDDYIHNQIAEPQSADMWIDGKGYFGTESVFTDTAWTESFEGVPDSITPPTNWAVDTVNDPGTDPVVSFEGSTKHPSGYSPSDGSVLVRFNSYYCPDDASSRLKQTAGIDMSTLGWTEATVAFDMFHDVHYSSSDDRVVLQYSTDGGATWVSLDTFHRYSSAGDHWETEMCSLPNSVLTATDLRIAFLFISDYGNDVYIDNVRLVNVETLAKVKIEDGKVEASDTIKGAHFRDFSGDLLLRSSDGSVNITEDSDGSYDLTVSGGGSGCVTLDGAYDCGGAGAGATITADAGPVIVDATSATNGALNVLANSSTNSALYVNNTGGGNGIWNDGNYWSPSGNVATGTGFFHTDTGWFQSNTDFVVKIDADDNNNNVFKVENSSGSVMFEVDEFGNAAIANDLLIATGGINDGVGTGAAGQVLTADGSGHLHWAYPNDNDWTRSGGYLYPRSLRLDTVLIGTPNTVDTYSLLQVDSGAVFIRYDSLGDLSGPALMVNNQNGSSFTTLITGINTYGLVSFASSDSADMVVGIEVSALSGTTAVGVYSQAFWGDTNRAIWGYADYFPTCWAGYFEGNVMVKGALELKVDTVAADSNHTVSASEYTILVNTGSDGTNTTITLPDASQWPGRVIVIKKIDSGTDGIDLVTSGTQTVDGMDDPTNVITTQYHAITIQSDGSNWWVIGRVN